MFKKMRIMTDQERTEAGREGPRTPIPVLPLVGVFASSSSSSGDTLLPPLFPATNATNTKRSFGAGSSASDAAKTRGTMGMSLSPSGQNIMMGDDDAKGDDRGKSKDSNRMDSKSDNMMTDGNTPNAGTTPFSVWKDRIAPTSLDIHGNSMLPQGSMWPTAAAGQGMPSELILCSYSYV